MTKFFLILMSMGEIVDLRLVLTSEWLYTQVIYLVHAEQVAYVKHNMYVRACRVNSECQVTHM